MKTVYTGSTLQAEVIFSKWSSINWLDKAAGTKETWFDSKKTKTAISSLEAGENPNSVYSLMSRAPNVVSQGEDKNTAVECWNCGYIHEPFQNTLCHL